MSWHNFLCGFICTCVVYSGVFDYEYFWCSMHYWIEKLCLGTHVGVVIRLRPFTLLLLATHFSDLVTLISELYSFKCAHHLLDSGNSLECLFVLGLGCLWCHFPCSSLRHSCYAPLLFWSSHLVDVALRSPTLLSCFSGYVIGWPPSICAWGSNLCSPYWELWVCFILCVLLWMITGFDYLSYYMFGCLYTYCVCGVCYDLFMHCCGLRLVF